jgi:uncharacterized protein (DUF1800 family)
MRLHVLALALAFVGWGCGTVPPATPVAEAPAGLALPATTLGETDRIVHVLDRLGYGPRPGDVERVRAMGLARYIEGQLRPESIPDAAADQALAPYRTLSMATADLLREYPRLNPSDAQRRQALDMSPRPLRETTVADRAPGRIVAELQAAKVARTVASERQLQEVMVDFWFNHFNVYAQKSSVRWMVTSYERDAIRPHALGRFADLVLATARHPAMLYYLDNWISVRPDLPPGPAGGRRAGLNENYARELMELHTLGVDGGYTQEDVVEVARCFTGWSIDRPQEEGRFVFRPRAHDGGAKRVLGHVIAPGGGEQDGVRVIEILARHPSTARFIATKLARRFVSDDPPPALVNRAARVFLRTGGDIRAVVESIVVSKEFFSEEVFRAKVKTPLELVASAVRALDGQLPEPAGAGPATILERALVGGGAATLARAITRLGQPLYEAQPPTGYPDRAEAWVNAGGLVGRMNFAATLAANRQPGVRVDLSAFARDLEGRAADQALERLVSRLLPGGASAETREAVGRRLAPGGRVASTAELPRAVALALASPEFQRR